MANSANELYGITGSIEPTRLSASYRVGLLVVALTMLVLPLVYLGLIALAAAVVWWHATANTWILTARGGGLWRAVGYFGPLVAGAVVTFFLVKPILARPARQVDPVPIGPGDDPELFEFIGKICGQVRAPVPARVQVDCQVNASAGFATVPVMPGAPRLVLTIGLPLAAGLTVRQFGGVLAHEFGHFAQGGGMRLTYIVRSINRWFSRVAYERDAWDEKLDEWSNRGNWMLSLTLHLAKASVWCSRQVLAGLMKTGHAISCFMLRQMEYDADSYEVKVAGTDAFAETSARMRELGLLSHVGHGELREAWLRRTVPSNLPAFVLQQHGRFSPEDLGRVRAVPEAKTETFDTHPSDADRIRAASNPRLPGILIGGDVPATALFRGFDGLSERATRHYYEHDLGLDLGSASLVDTEEAFNATRDRDEKARMVQSFFGDRLSIFRPLRVELPGDGANSPADLAAALLDARTWMASEAGRVEEQYRTFESLEHDRQLALAAREIIASGFPKVEPEGFNLTIGTAADAEAAAARAASQQKTLSAALTQFETMATRRIACALALLREPDAGPTSVPMDGLDSATRAELGGEGEHLRQTLNALAGIWPHLNELYEASELCGHLSANVTNSPKPDLTADRLKRAFERFDAALRNIHAALVGLPGPDPSSNVTLLAAIGMPEDAGVKAEEGVVLARTGATRYDLIGRLAAIALRVEAAMGSSVVEGGK